MEDRSFFDEIDDLIDRKAEGAYWDYKQQWHTANGDLLHDIICMANNLADRDAYIIIGVTDSKSPGGVKIIGVPSDKRRDQNELVVFLRDKKFAGGIRPTVYVKTLDFVGGQVDVLIIKNSSRTPFYLTEKFEDVWGGNIYTRVGDTNTPKIATADVDKTEYLWRKRFGIDKSAMERLSLLLNNPEDWDGDLGNEYRLYHKLYPEYQLKIDILSEDDSHKGAENMARLLTDLQCDKQFDPKDDLRMLNITYHSTLLFSHYVVFLDGGRCLVPIPESGTINLGERYDMKTSLTYQFFDFSTILGKLFLCLAGKETPWYLRKWGLSPGVGFLRFADSPDREAFETFAKEHLSQTVAEYNDALAKKGIVRTAETEDLFRSGWSKANDTKAWFLFERYRGLSNKPIVHYVNIY